MTATCRRLEGRVAVVTGGGRGIGRAVVERLAAEGAAVVFTQRTRTDAESLERDLSAGGADVEFVEADVTDADQVEKVFDTVAERHGRLDIVCNNAAVGLLKDVASTSNDEFTALFATNVQSVFHTSRFAVPLMTAGGSIVNVGSIAGEVGLERDAAYCATKGAVHALTRQMALDYAAHGIRVNCVAPGFIETDQLLAYIDSHGRDAAGVRADVVALHPLGRIGAPADVAAAVAYLVSDDASFITGSTLVVDGGLLAR